jgi:superoxide reductase
MATEAGQVYRCKICGNKVKVVAAGGGVLVCCGIPMKLENNN